VLPILERERPVGVLVQFGGQTALNLAAPLANAGVEILGTSVPSVDISEDREKFAALLTTLGIDRPDGGGVRSLEACDALLARIGLPVVVRPSYVLGGRGMEIAETAAQVRSLVTDALLADPAHPVLIDRYIDGLEIEVDAISDGTSVLIPAIMEHIEHAGIA
jgi:carbamoyl-phosphate synthase large subunit